MSKEIIEGNKKIADFADICVKEWHGKDGDVIGLVIVDAHGQVDWGGAEFFAPNSNWDQLMLVVEKIMLYRYPDYWSGGRPRPQDADYYEDCAYMRTFGMRDTDGNYMVRINAQAVFHAKTLIEATWLAVDDFITYYNQTK